MNLTLEARQFLRTTRSGILSTHSSKFEGYPFGSVAPFVLDHTCQPIVLISNIAEHTKNIQANPKVSLLVFAGNDDLQANARLTLLGEAIKINKTDKVNLRARYLRYLPQAASYFDMHDFAFYRIQIRQSRYIGGFGKMGWFSGEGLTEQLNKDTPLASQESAIIEHMNTDHAKSLMSYCQHFHGLKASQAEMIGIDCDGFDLSAKINDANTVLRFNFDAPIYDAQSARAALVTMSKLANTSQ